MSRIWFPSGALVTIRVLSIDSTLTLTSEGDRTLLFAIACEAYPCIRVSHPSAIHVVGFGSLAAARVPHSELECCEGSNHTLSKGRAFANDWGAFSSRSYNTRYRPQRSECT
eukprot:5827400-Amphidinium_carterae.1